MTSLHRRTPPPPPHTRCPYTLVSEFCEGGSLQQLLLRHAQAGTVLDWDTALRFTRGLAAAMFYLHSRAPLAVVHRDLKPANCLIVRSSPP